MRLQIYLSSILLGALIVPSLSLPTKQDKGMFDLLDKVINDRELSKAESLKTSNKKILLGTKPNPDLFTKNEKGKEKQKTSRLASFRTDILRQELARESQDNCLAKLLCGSATTTLPSKTQAPSSSVIVNDYTLLVKEFLDLFGTDDSPPPVKKNVTTTTTPKPKKKEENQDEESDEEDEENEEEEDELARAGEKFVNVTGSLEEAVSTTSTVSSVTTGATITEYHPLLHAVITKDKESFGGSEGVEKITLEELLGNDEDSLNSKLRKVRRGKREPKLLFKNLRDEDYIHRQLREMKFANSETEKLKIAGKIANKLRQPRQCRDFSHVASQILTTCPLTTEVVRYFNDNLKNGSQIALVKRKKTSTDGGLVVLNDQGGVPHPYFLDNSPIIANTYIATDLKNPSVHDRFPVNGNGEIRHPIYENAFPQKVDISKVSLTQEPVKKKQPVKKKEKPEEEESDEEEDEEEEDDAESEENDEDEERRRSDLLRGSYKMQKKNKKEKTKVQQGGTIKVYGVSQPSFDNEFSKISSQIGKGQIILFDHDDEDADHPHPGPSLESTRPKRPRPQKKVKPVEVEVDSGSDEEEAEVELEEEQQPKRRVRENTKEVKRIQRVFPTPIPVRERMTVRPYNLAKSPVFNSFPAPRPEEYYMNGKPRRPRPPTPYEIPYKMVYKPRPEIRGRLNFVHSPSSALMRPYAHNPYNRPYRPY